MELTSNQIIELCPMKIELVSNRKICLLSKLKLGNIFFENKKFSGKNGYFISYNNKLLVLASLNYRGKFNLGFPNHFTNIEDIEVYQPHIFRQLNGKYKDNLIYFPAHINAATYSVISQLGFIPPDHLFKIAEITRKEDLLYFENNLNSNEKITFIANSDSHYNEQIGKRFTRIYDKQLIENYIQYLFFFE